MKLNWTDMSLIFPVLGGARKCLVRGSGNDCCINTGDYCQFAPVPPGHLSLVLSLFLASLCCHIQRTAAASVVLSVFRPYLVVCPPDVCKPLHVLGYICLAQRRGCVYTYLELVAGEDTAPLRKACLRTVK